MEGGIEEEQYETLFPHVLQNLKLPFHDFLDPKQQEWSQLHMKTVLVYRALQSQTLFWLQILQAIKELATKGQHSDAVLQVGIIGGGHLCQLILSNLMRRQDGIRKYNVHVSTRQPELLLEYTKCATIYFDNLQVAHHSEVLIMACLPHQLPAICNSIRGVLKPDTIIIAVQCSLTFPRASQLFQTDLVIFPLLDPPVLAQKVPESNQAIVNIQEYLNTELKSESDCINSIIAGSQKHWEKQFPHIIRILFKFTQSKWPNGNEGNILNQILFKNQSWVPDTLQEFEQIMLTQQRITKKGAVLLRSKMLEEAMKEGGAIFGETIPFVNYQPYS